MKAFFFSSILLFLIYYRDKGLKIPDPDVMS